MVAMTPSTDQEYLSYERLEALCGERETTIHTLRRQMKALEAERDQALNGLEAVTRGLRRRGCCDSGHAH